LPVAGCRLPISSHRGNDFHRESQFQNRNWMKGGEPHVP